MNNLNYRLRYLARNAFNYSYCEYNNMAFRHYKQRYWKTAKYYVILRRVRQLTRINRKRNGQTH